MRKRTLRPGEAALWNKVTRTVQPLHDALTPSTAQSSPPSTSTPGSGPAQTPEATRSGQPAPKTSGVSQPAASRTRVAPQQKRIAPPPADIDRKTRRKLNRGTMAIDARIDLHGLTLAEAEGRLVRFVAEASGRGARAALVITGKGRAGEGLLRREVPHWLARPDLRRHVVGFGPAGPAHGGDGALYVRLRPAKRGRG